MKSHPPVACVGTGLVGRSWAIVFARAGHEVRLWDAQAGTAEAARDFAAEMLPELERLGLIEGAAADALARITPVAELEAALDGVAHVQESTPEEIGLKREVFGRLDALAGPDTVLASSSSALLPSAISEGLAGRHRCMVNHPINPAYLVPAAELVPAPWTEPALVARTADMLRAAGMRPMVMNKEIQGFVMNRLQGALLHEAFRLVADGYASAEDVDIGLREGLALRWSFIGPFETIDLNAPEGVRQYVERYSGIYTGLSDQPPADWQGPVLDRIEAERRAALPGDELAARQAWRDRRLMALAAHKRRAADEIGE
ncbi:3-hydroxybutyryl-CoA dehydrogenase [Oceanicola granulosus HTCC2516]|uniref:3-hydroxybutyryl-CoA dehydrogenase n=1 Tax=Oceanicola granulosus (strain ATCC BAA-861 / DSM 15982 / KCTC 12143 / HTCC2516) TaxID=314256 RepID=Q2CA35_OCEGH|nr:3-hydroxyacyl-CoA dehydrogenase [Oceanicola granulosus]EAR49530.1 3-hydroxybutyryl-CoA dehydrogenase [Oceanicola granulosus HTCC2516]